MLLCPPPPSERAVFLAFALHAASPKGTHVYIYEYDSCPPHTSDCPSSVRSRSSLLLRGGGRVISSLCRSSSSQGHHCFWSVSSPTFCSQLFHRGSLRGCKFMGNFAECPSAPPAFSFRMGQVLFTSRSHVAFVYSPHGILEAIRPASVLAGLGSPASAVLQNSSGPPTKNKQTTQEPPSLYRRRRRRHRYMEARHQPHRAKALEPAGNKIKA